MTEEILPKDALYRAVLLAPSADAALRNDTEAALVRRGFETVHRCRIGAPEDAQVAALCRAHVGGEALIGYRVRVGDDARFDAGDAPFDSRGRAQACYHVGACLGVRAEKLRIAPTAAMTTQLVTVLTDPGTRADIAARVRAGIAAMRTADPVIADLSRHSHRARVEIVTRRGSPVVKKTYRATAVAQMRNQIDFHREIEPLSAVPPRLLGHTDNALYFEHIEMRPFAGRLPLEALGQLVAFFGLAAGHGWDLVDLTPRDNVLIDGRTGALRCIDFEFAVKRGGPFPLDEAYAFSGIPDHAPAAAIIADPDMRIDPYPGKWRRYTGLGRGSLLHAPAWRQRLERAALHPAWLAQRAAGAPTRRQRYLRKRRAILCGLALAPC